MQKGIGICTDAFFVFYSALYESQREK